MKKVSLLLQQFGVIALGSLMVALSIAQFETPYFLQANLLVIKDVAQAVSNDPNPSNSELMDSASETHDKGRGRLCPPEGCRPSSGEAEKMQIQEAQRILQGHQRDYQNRQRELEVNSQDTTATIASLEPLFSEWEMKIQVLEQASHKNQLEAFWGLDQDLDELELKVDELFQLFYQEERFANIARQLQDREQELSTMEQVLPSTPKQQPFFDRTKIQLEILQQKYGQILAFDQYTENDLDDLEYDLNGLSDMARDFLDRSSNRSQAKGEGEGHFSEAQRLFKEKQFFLKEKERDIKDHKINKQDTAKLESLLKDMKDALQKMESLVHATPFNAEVFWDLNATFDALDLDYWGLSQEMG